LKLKPAFAAVAFAMLLAGSASNAAGDGDSAYAHLRDAYAKGDASGAADAYSDHAVYGELYLDTVPVLRVGRSAIHEGFAGLFAQFGLASPSNPVDLNFRITSRQKTSDGLADAGFYRLTVGKGSRAQRYYGAFATQIEGRKFVSDSSAAAGIDQFEGAAGPLLFGNGDEMLAGEYYDRHVGLYSDGKCNLVVTRSAWRLFALDECTGQWRGLARLSGLEWTAGKTVLDSQIVGKYRFDLGKSLTISHDGADTVYTKQTAFETRHVGFGTSPRLAGTLYLPLGEQRPRPAIVLAHGSGEQDRHGYASIIALMAQRLARAGMVVLTYDKRGVVESEGDWASARFDELAADASAGLAYVRTLPEVDRARTGFGGSSQAGWVVAKAIEKGADPAFTLLVGAAGSALTVAEQNIYNTEVRMQCEGFSASDVKLATDQQRAFFATRRDPSKALDLTQKSAAAAKRPAVRDWLIPATVAAGGEPQWYDILSADFDPLPVWREYRGVAYFLFSEMDDSTPSSLAVLRLKPVRSAQVKTLGAAHHIGLSAKSRCDGEIGPLTKFHPEFFRTLDAWAASPAR
jgi:dienelactone hydrolase